MAKAAHFYARSRRLPIPHARLAHTLRRRGPRLVDRDDVDGIVLAPTLPQESAGNGPRRDPG
jgi:hypothetical protein